MFTMFRSPQFLILVVALVALFGAFHPVLYAAGLCGSGGCPEAEASGTPTGFSLPCIAVVASAAGGAALVFFSFLLGRRPAGRLRLYDLSLCPDSPPPKGYLPGY